MMLWSKKHSPITNNTLKAFGLFSAILFVCLFNFLPNAISKDNSVKVPGDFQVTLVSAGRGVNSSERITVTIDASGACQYWEDNNVAGEPEEKRNFARFSIDKQAVARIYGVVQKERFFELKDEYRDKDIYDGDLVLMKITAGKQSGKVMAVNIAVDAIDNIVRQINKELPDQYLIGYNALRGFSFKRVER